MRGAVVIIGCDPGITGALAILEGESLVDVFDMPTRTKRVNGADRPVIDEQGITDMIHEWALKGAKRFIIERVGGLPGQSAPRAFTFGYGFGVVLSVARMLHFDVVQATPLKWRGALEIHSRGRNTKHGSMEQATQFWGDEHWKRVKDHGRAEAALIALYGARFIWPAK